MTITIAEAGGLALLGFITLELLGRMPGTRAVLGFLGVVLIGTGGFIGRLLADFGTWAQDVFGSLTNWAVGVPLVFGLFAATAIVVIHDMHPKNSASRRTGWASIALGAFIVAGVQGIPALHGIRDGIVSGTSSALSTITSA